jgi:hypothetical protein
MSQQIRPARPSNGLELHPDLRTTARRLGMVASHHVEGLLAELPATVRRIRTFILIMTIAIPAFLAVAAVVLWRLVR